MPTSQTVALTSELFLLPVAAGFIVILYNWKVIMNDLKAVLLFIAISLTIVGVYADEKTPSKENTELNLGKEHSMSFEELAKITSFLQPEGPSLFHVQPVPYISSLPKISNWQVYRSWMIFCASYPVWTWHT